VVTACEFTIILEYGTVKDYMRAKGQASGVNMMLVFVLQFGGKDSSTTCLQLVQCRAHISKDVVNASLGGNLGKKEGA